MITSLRLLQTKYSLSDEFIANAIRAEIERQALLDIKGVISNASPLALDAAAKIIVEPRTTLDDVAGKANDQLVAGSESSDMVPEMKANKRRGNRVR